MGLDGAVNGGDVLVPTSPSPVVHHITYTNICKVICSGALSSRYTSMPTLPIACPCRCPCMCANPFLPLRLPCLLPARPLPMWLHLRQHELPINFVQIGDENVHHHLLIGFEAEGQ